VKDSGEQEGEEEGMGMLGLDRRCREVVEGSRKKAR